MQRRLVLPDRTLRRRSTTNIRGSGTRSTPSPRCRDCHHSGCSPNPGSNSPYSEEDWQRVQIPSDNYFHASSSPRSSIRRGRKRKRRKSPAPCLTRPQGSQERQSQLPYVPGCYPTVSHSTYVTTRWSDVEESDICCSDATSESSFDALDVFEEHDDRGALHSYSNMAHFIPEMVDHFHHVFQTQRASARYIIPPDHRIRTQHPRPILLESHDPTNSMTLITPVTGYYPLRCPFHSCSIPSTSISSLIAHLQVDHREPIYCPICGDRFSAFRTRDEHVRAQTCEYKEHFDIEGIDDRRLERIAERDDPSMDEEGRWRKIWKQIFPRLEAPSPWIMEGTGLEVVMARDWWRAEGRRCVEDYLEAKMLGGGISEDLEKALVVQVGEELIKKVWT